MAIWVMVAAFVVGGFTAAILTSRSNKSTINKYNGYTETPAEISEKERINRADDITKLGTLRSQGAITNEEYERMVNALSVNHVAVKPQSKGFPKSLYLLPVFFGVIGGIIGALIVARVYKTKWWQMILVGIITSVIAYVIYAAIIPMPQ